MMNTIDTTQGKPTGLNQVAIFINLTGEIL